MAYKFLIILIYIKVIKVKWDNRTKQANIFKLVWILLVPFCFIMFAITSRNLHNSILFLLCQSFIVNTFFSMSKSSNTVNMIDLEVEMIEPIF